MISFTQFSWELSVACICKKRGTARSINHCNEMEMTQCELLNIDCVNVRRSMYQNSTHIAANISCNMLSTTASLCLCLHSKNSWGRLDGIVAFLFYQYLTVRLLNLIVKRTIFMPLLVNRKIWYWFFGILRFINRTGNTIWWSSASYPLIQRISIVKYKRNRLVNITYNN